VASRATEPTRPARAIRRAATALAAGCCVLGLASLPTAQAAKSTTTSSSTAPVETVAAPHTKRERAALNEAPAPPAAPVLAPATAAPLEPPLAGHAKHVRPAAPPPPALGAPAGSGSSPRKLDREAAKPRVRRHQDGAVIGETTEGQGDQTAAVSSDAATQDAEALARKQKKEKPKKEKAKKEKASKEKGTKGKGGEGKGSEGKGGEGKGGEQGEESSSTSGQTSGRTKGAQDAEVAASEPVAAAASVATPTPAGGTAEASIDSFTPSAGGVGGHALRAAHGPRRLVKSAASTSAGAATPAIVPATLFASAGPDPADGLTAAARASAEPKRAAGQPAIVKTFTRIVGVVPTPVRILIAVLVALALALAVRSRLSSVRARRLSRQRGQLLEDVGLLQAALLPVPPVRLGPVGTSVAYRPADGPGAGGDFYDVFGLEDGRVAVIVGDVSGHGREALPHTALVRFTVRAYLEAGLSPRKALQTAGTVLDRQLAGSFATVVAAVYHPRERTLTYASAGHPPPLVLGDAGDHGAEGDGATAPVAIELTTACSAPPLGAGMRTGTRETIISVPGPARLCFHTDGVTEARIGEDLFGSERLTVALADLGREGSAAALLDSVAERTDARPDDMAACLLRVEDGAGAPSVLHELLELDAATIDNGRAERLLRESGMSAAAAAAAIAAARGELDRLGSVLLQLGLGDGAPVAVLEHDNVVHTAALAAVSAS
jgi:hypothetical protein